MSRVRANGVARRYAWTGRPFPSFLMSRLSTHRRRRSSCIAMLTSGCRSPVPFSMSTEVVSSRAERNTSAFATFFGIPVLTSISTVVSSRGRERASLLIYRGGKYYCAIIYVSPFLPPAICRSVFLWGGSPPEGLSTSRGFAAGWSPSHEDSAHDNGLLPALQQ